MEALDGTRLPDFMESTQMRRNRKRLVTWQLVPWGHLAKILLAYPDFIHFLKEILYNSYNFIYQSIEFSRSVVSDSVTPWTTAHRFPCPSPTPGAYSDSWPSRWWCHPTITSFAISFSSRSQSFPASRSFPRSQFFTSGGQSIGASASASVLPMKEIRTDFL